ncbi:kinase-like domain-containing protein [Pilobolus umbonatus]|nr:kinase-like domain-containing protein [Pilobolus umbonatus]
MGSTLTNNSNKTIEFDTDLSRCTTVYHSSDDGLFGRQSSKRKNEADTDHGVSKEARLEGNTDSHPVKSDDERKGLTFKDIYKDYDPPAPDWDQHKDAWAYLQSLTPLHESIYLVKKEVGGIGRAGYLLGRSPECDVVFTNGEISKRHCLIYMETGATAKIKGLRIYLEDLRAGSHCKDPLDIAFRILFPFGFEANSCEVEYQLYEKIGTGNSGLVFRGVHRKSNREVAIKIMDKSKFASKPKSIEAITQEVGISMALESHPLLVRIEKFFNEEKRMFLVLEYVKGGELFNMIVKRKRLCEDDTRFIFWQLFTAIRYLHDRNIAHRDLKPENILMANEKLLHIKIADFGLAINIKRNKTLDSQCGTPNYVAPEVLSPSSIRSYNSQCDMWSLGVMLYICLCGYPPFGECEGISMKRQILGAIYSFNSPDWDDISDEAKDLISKLLTVDPAKRLPAAAALVSAHK